MAIAWIPLCFLALAAQRLFGIRHTMYSVFSLVHFWDLSQGLLGLVFLSSEHFLCTSPKNQSGSRRNSSRRAWVAHGTGAKKGLLETNCVLKCSTHVCPSVVCLSAGGYVWMASLLLRLTPQAWIFMVNHGYPWSTMVNHG